MGRVTVSGAFLFENTLMTNRRIPNDYERHVIELYHNLFRMHGYVEAAMANMERPPHGILERANLVLRNTYLTVRQLIPADVSCLLEIPEGVEV